jgi:hypothetical protein
MTEKHIRGELLVFAAAPKDENGAAVSPALVQLYLNYKHADDTTSTDIPINMDEDATTSGLFSAIFDTKVCEPGPLFWSIRTISPPAAADGKITIIANAANPDPST